MNPLDEPNRRVKAWLMEHEDHISDEVRDNFALYSPLRCYHWVLAHFDAVYDQDMHPTQPLIVGGCVWRLRHGSYRGMLCQRPLAPGSSMCVFHSHPVFELIDLGYTQ